MQNKSSIPDLRRHSAAYGDVGGCVGTSSIDGRGLVSHSVLQPIEFKDGGGGGDDRVNGASGGDVGGFSVISAASSITTAFSVAIPSVLDSAWFHTLASIFPSIRFREYNIRFCITRDAVATSSAVSPEFSPNALSVF